MLLCFGAHVFVVQVCRVAEVCERLPAGATQEQPQDAAGRAGTRHRRRHHECNGRAADGPTLQH